MSFLLDPPLLYASGRVSPNWATDAATVGMFATYPIWLWLWTRERR